jgi:hypothetical protein
VTTPLQQQLIVVQLDLARTANTRERQLEIARRRVNRIASVLGVIAAAVAVYDLSLLAAFGHS